MVMDRVSSGVKGLDEILGGGFPKGRTILAVGSPGSGKTILALQFLQAGAVTGERSIYITFDEKPEQVKENVSEFGWDVDRLESEGKILFVDATPFRRMEGSSAASSEGRDHLPLHEVMPELTLGGLIEAVKRLAEDEDVTRLAVDPITSISVRYLSPVKRRRAMLMLFDALSSTGATCLVTSEMRTSMLSRRFQLEEFLSQGVVLLRTGIHEGNVVRAVQVEKMRGIAHDTQLRPYLIGQKGIEVFAKDKVFK
jgi:KaiC/GvpD/RAD55 family RecA-like ATPase